MGNSELQAFLRGELSTRTIRSRAHKEDSLQMACVKWFDLQYPNLSKLLFHPANGGSRKYLEAVRFKKMGVRAGVADLVLLVPNAEHPFLCLELKNGKEGRQSDNQRKWQQIVELIGGKYIVIRSIEQFVAEVRNYLSTSRIL